MLQFAKYLGVEGKRDVQLVVEPYVFLWRAILNVDKLDKSLAVKWGLEPSDEISKLRQDATRKYEISLEIFFSVR